MLGSIYSIILHIRTGEITLSAFRDHTGSFGIGTREFWTQIHSNHIRVSYPISMKQWTDALDNELNFPKYQQWGESGKIEYAKNYAWSVS